MIKLITGAFAPFAAGIALAFVAFGASPARADDLEDSLATVEVPLDEDLSDFVKSVPAAIRLGKALFFDEQTGGDGRIACATCHFSAGVDSRVINTVTNRSII